jgi:hypothetical protein
MAGVEGLAGFGTWGGSLEALLGHRGPLWLFGEAGCGLSTLGAWLAQSRGAAFQDDAERLDRAALRAWLDANPAGVLASHLTPEDPSLAPAASRCLSFRLPSLEDEPGDVERCLGLMAEEEGFPGPLPPALAALPCPGNLRGLRNRLVRWKLLGQLPEDAAPRLPLADSEDLAANLHVLERLLLHRALRRSYGNRVEAAKRLGVSRRQLYLLIARHGDPVRGEAPTQEGPKRLRRAQNSRIEGLHR